MKKVLTIAALILIAILVLLFWIRRFGGHLEQSAPLTGSSIFAEVRVDSFAAATDANSVSVYLYRNEFSFGDVVFDAATYGGGAIATWRDASHLDIHLKRPQQLEIRCEAADWNGIKISYVRDPS